MIDRKKSVLAEWETGVGGIRWLEKLIEEGKATKPCWKCSEHTSVFGFILPAGHETLEPDEEDDERDAWYRYDEPTIVHYVTDLLPAVAARIKAFSRHYRVDFSKTTQSSYWMNHCEHCGMKQGDFEMYCEPQGAFFPMDEHAASLIVLHEFVEPFGCNGSTAYGDHLFEYMRRA
ncbi:conjugal transfer protein TraC [Betaproteobacteria bacterium PRO5]|nr:conjugal transfer protein TraC [Betaproteobacteria bacterium PRO5]